VPCRNITSRRDAVALPPPLQPNCLVTTYIIFLEFASDDATDTDADVDSAASVDACTATATNDDGLQPLFVSMDDEGSPSLINLPPPTLASAFEAHNYPMTAVLDNVAIMTPRGPTADTATPVKMADLLTLMTQNFNSACKETRHDRDKAKQDRDTLLEKIDKVTMDHTMLLGSLKLTWNLLDHKVNLVEIMCLKTRVETMTTTIMTSICAELEPELDNLRATINKVFDTLNDLWSNVTHITSTAILKESKTINNRLTELRSTYNTCLSALKQ
jgi:hypothetical protein